MEESGIPDSGAVFPNEYGTSVFLKNIVKAENIIVGDYTYYDDTKSPLDWEHNNVLFNLYLQESPSSKRSKRWRGMEEG